MKRSNNFLVVSFLIIIFGVLVFYPVKFLLIKINVIDFNMTDNWLVYQNKGANLLGKINDKIMSLENSINNRTTNYFPFYEEITSAFYQINMGIDSIFSNDYFVKTNSDSEYLFFNEKYQFFYLINNLSTDEMDKRLDKQINFYNNINKNHSDVKLYIYLPLRYELNDIDKVRNLDNYVDLFIDKLDNSIKTSKLETKTVTEYLKYFYKTDHHYNAYGAQKAYYDILNMMNLTDNTEYKFKTIQDPYYGSMAKNSLSKKVSDKLIDIDYNKMPSVNQSDKLFKPRQELNKKKTFYDYYIGYFNGQYDEVIYNNDIKTNRNLLIFSDSLSWQIDYLLANNFDSTYVINMRYGKWLKETFDLDKYITKNNITDILFLQEAETEMFDIYNHHLAERVIN